MLKPSMQELMKRVNNRYLLVNLSAQRARDLSAAEETAEQPLEEKPIKIALDEICNGKIEYRQGPKPAPEPEQDILAAAVAEDLEEADDELLTEEDAEPEADASAELTLEEL
ncbi:MAG: DNA-directed RNA polymerase subunit omega [Eubacteriales bacterium]|nr:DNA-directed RNA polymerase subunit omega [Eubacteriales bacterium]